jgi:hypothetical protein
MSDDPILAALVRLEAGQQQLRANLMAGMDRLEQVLESMIRRREEPPE